MLDMLYIGNDIQERMALLGLTADEVADKTFLDVEYVNEIINNQVSLEAIDEFDFALICNVLHCKPEYFTDEATKAKDFLMASKNRGSDTEKSLNVKAKIQDFVNDFSFVNSVLTELD